MKTIGVLSSGGDAPGMNAAIRAVVRYGIYLGMRVYGIERGFAGLLDGCIYEMNMGSVSDIVQRGGTILKTARCDEFRKESGQWKAIAQLKKNKIEGLIVIGGDGSLKGAMDLSELGFPSVGIPGTIDNDLAYTDYTLGFDTACNTALDAINKLRDTMTSHERVAIVQVMGRHCGDLALYCGIGGGAEIIIVPEIPVDLKEVCQKLLAANVRGKHSEIIVLAEGAGNSAEIAATIEKRTGIPVRTTVLGYIQRGGNPSMQDRFLGTNMGAYAVQLLEKNIGNRIIGIKNNRFYDIDIVEGLALKKEFNKELFETANIVAK